MSAIVTPPTIVCPMCPLHCDDVTVQSNGHASAHGCHLAESQSWHPSASRTNPIGLQRVRSSQRLRVITSGTDLTTARRLVELHQDRRIHLEINADASVAAWGEMTRRDGIVGCTLSEITVRSDWVWVIGNADDAWPRLNQRLHREAIVERGGTWKHDAAITIDTLTPHLASIDAISPTPAYAVVLIAPGAFEPDEAPIAAALLGRWIRTRNTTHRTCGLTLDPAATLQSVSLWKTNTMIGISHSASTATSIRMGDACRDDAAMVDLQIGGTDPGPSLAAMYLPAARMGFHHRSQVIRGDGSVTLPLSNHAAASSDDSDLASPSDVLEKVLATPID